MAMRKRRLQDAHSFPGFQPLATVRGVFGDPQVRIVQLVRRRKKRREACGKAHRAFYDQRPRWVGDLACGDTRIYLKLAVRRV
ncbi:MAG TPA: hypothetical protein VKB84_07740 [Candidatus Binataceae bacterium]|jgi:hypothetical protein|nr:hypothetical protein [Candidatus Binataceae bacterium]